MKHVSFIFFYCDAECRCKHNTENKGAKNDNIYHQKPASFGYYIKSVFEQSVPSGCHHFFGDDFEEWFVEEMRDLENKIYNIFNKSSVKSKMTKRAQNKYRGAKKNL